MCACARLLPVQRAAQSARVPGSQAVLKQASSADGEPEGGLFRLACSSPSSPS